MRVSFWGVRGSLPAPRRTAWRYGGNTPCVEVRAGGSLFILDAGSGIQELGRQLGAESASPGLKAHLLFTHYHWDHIQGLPFFEPIYCASSALKVYGPRPLEGDVGLAGVLPALFRRPFFPVAANQLSSTCYLEELAWNSHFSLGEMCIRTCRLNHPQGALAYRLHCGGTSVVYATDHEPGDTARDRALRELAHGADLLICDAQYLPEEMAQKRGWGHGSWETSIAIACDAGVKNLVLFHHDPFRSDREVDQLLSRARQAFPNTWAAAEGTLFEVSPAELHLTSRVARSNPPAQVHLSVQLANPFGSRDTRHAGTAQGGTVSVRGAPAAGEEEFALVLPDSNGQRTHALPSAEAFQRLFHGLAAAPDNPGATSSCKNGGNSSPRSQLAEPRPPSIPAFSAFPGASEPDSIPDPGKQALRRYERISLERTEAHAVFRDGVGPRMVRLLDLSMGGVSFLLDEATPPPETFYARLHVPLLKFSPPDLKLHRVYSRRVAQDLYRVGCRFVAWVQ